MTAAIYAARARLSTVLVEKTYPGGQVMMCDRIENYPGFSGGSSGMELATQMREQAEKFGMETKLVDVGKVELTGKDKILYAGDEEIKAKTVILSLGARPRQLDVPGRAGVCGKGSLLLRHM